MNQVILALSILSVWLCASTPCPDWRRRISESHKKIDVVKKIGGGGTSDVYLVKALGVDGREVKGPGGTPLRLAAKPVPTKEGSSEHNFDMLSSDLAGYRRLYPQVVEGFGPIVDFVRGPNGEPFLVFPVFMDGSQPARNLDYASVGDSASFPGRAAEKFLLPPAPNEDPYVGQQHTAFVKGLFSELQIIHKRGVLSNDIKPANIVLQFKDGMPRPRIIDFDISSVLKNGKYNVPLEYNKPAGTENIRNVEALYNVEATTFRDTAALSRVILKKSRGRLNPNQEMLLKSEFAKTPEELERLYDLAGYNATTFEAEFVKSWAESFAEWGKLEKKAGLAPEVKAYYTAAKQAQAFLLLSQGAAAREVINGLGVTQKTELAKFARTIYNWVDGFPKQLEAYQKPSATDRIFDTRPESPDKKAEEVGWARAFQEWNFSYGRWEKTYKESRMRAPTYPFEIPVDIRLMPAGIVPSEQVKQQMKEVLDSEIGALAY